MKNQVTRILTIGIALAGVVAVHAQDKGVTANVPFSFYVGSSAMPQGAYRVSEFSNGAVVRLTAMHKNATKAMTTMNVSGKKVIEPARLVFHCYGQEYFLAEIWTGEGPNGRALPRSQRERELAQSGAGPTLAMTQVALHR